MNAASVLPFTQPKPEAPNVTHHQGDRSAIKALREKIVATKARAAEIAAEKEALLTKALEDRLQQELDALENQVKSLDDELSLIRERKDELTVCSSELCETVFIPTKAGQSLCPDCDKRLNPAPVAVIQAPAPSPKKHPVVPALPIKSEELSSLEPCAKCRKPHRRSAFHEGPTSKCLECRYKPAPVNNHEVAPKATSDKIKNSIREAAKDIILQDKPPPDWLSHQVEIDRGKTIILAKITGHPDLPDHPEFFCRFSREVTPPSSKR